MSEEEVEIARRAFEEASRVRDPAGSDVDALDRETLAVVFDFFDPEIELHEDPRFPEAGVYRGLEAVSRYFAQFTENFDEFTFKAEDFIDLGGDRVLILFRLRTRGSGSGATVEARPGWIYTIRDGKAVRIETYLDRGEALAAAGLGPTR
jgi:ketosteroid isomerase-like protein